MILNPVPGSTREQNNGSYPADSGVDIMVPVGTSCVACADGDLIYSELGHTPWYEDQNPSIPGLQGPYSILLRLHEPFTYAGLTVRYAWYTHLSGIVHQVADGSSPRRVRAGERLGWTGIGNNVPHLHFGLLSHRAQRDGEYLPPSEVSDLIWSRTGRERPSEQPRRPHHRTKIFLHDNRARGFIDGDEQSALDIRVRLEPLGKLLIWLNGSQVDGVAVTLDLAFDRFLPKSGPDSGPSFPP